MISKLVPILFLVIFSGCGVKGRPLPPLKPSPLGHGEPKFNQSEKDINLKPKKKKKIVGDWDDVNDFEDENQ